MPQQFAVVGLGTFGRSVALNLAHSGQAVLAVDRNEEEVAALAGELDAVVCVDATDEATLREIGVDRMACVVVAIGAESMEASILVTALLRQLGVPRIVARALTELHARVLHAVGAHEVVSPEAEMGLRLARRLAEPNVIARLELGTDAELAELAAPQSFVGKSLVELDVRRRSTYRVTPSSEPSRSTSSPSSTRRLRAGETVMVIGSYQSRRRRRPRWLTCG